MQEQLLPAPVVFADAAADELGIPVLVAAHRLVAEDHVAGHVVRDVVGHVGHVVVRQIDVRGAGVQPGAVQRAVRPRAVRAVRAERGSLRVMR